MTIEQTRLHQLESDVSRCVDIIEYLMARIDRLEEELAEVKRGEKSDAGKLNKPNVENEREGCWTIYRNSKG